MRSQWLCDKFHFYLCNMTIYDVLNEFGNITLDQGLGQKFQLGPSPHMYIYFHPPTLRSITPILFPHIQSSPLPQTNLHLELSMWASLTCMERAKKDWPIFKTGQHFANLTRLMQTCGLNGPARLYFFTWYLESWIIQKKISIIDISMIIRLSKANFPERCKWEESK